MTREELLRRAAERYSTEPEFPWGDDNCILRHASNRKWFAAVLRVPYGRLGIPKEGMADVLNTKCPPLLMGSYRSRPGILPAYHMNKEHWLSALLDGTAEDEVIRELLEISYDVTNGQKKR
ncbi:MAG: MmcQ/YjbR family DNA-binding protein [Oscillospiraceae bacterium]|nr:MmcQ/YjbR family DNA-binding protein [Oscillospiraceae bacterium]